jgi:hypothetical protein
VMDLVRSRSLPATLCLLGVVASFLVLGGIHLDALGMPSEEIRPHLFVHPRVAAGESLSRGRIVLLPPNDGPDGSERAGLIASPSWPTLSIVRPPHAYPLLTEAWQAAYLSYGVAALEPLLGTGIVGLRRSGLLLGGFGLVLVAMLARRLARTSSVTGASDAGPWLGVASAAWLASSVGFLFFHRFAFLIETGPPLAAALALFWALDGRATRSVLAAFAAGLALALKITIAWVLLGMAVYLVTSRRWPKLTARVWIVSVTVAPLPLIPLAILWRLGGMPAKVAHKALLGLHPFDGLARLPRLASLTATFLGRPGAVLGPMFEGKPEIETSLLTAVVPALVTLFAVAVTWKRKEDRGPERLWLCVTAVVVLCGALFYSDKNPVQVALVLLPFYAIVVARMLFGLTRALASSIGNVPALALVILGGASIKGSEIAGFIALHRSIANPMLSMEAQRELTDAIVARGDAAPLTTTYNAVGFIELLSNLKVAPIHLYPLLTPSSNSVARQRAVAERAFRIALTSARGPVVLSLAHNIFEGGGQDVDLVHDAFAAASAALGLEVREIGRYPAKGPPLLGLYEAVGHIEGTHVESGGEEEPRAGGAQPQASRATLAALGGVSPGARVGPFAIDAVTGPLDGAIRVHATSPIGGVTYEIRLWSAAPAPPARAGNVAVFYDHQGSTPLELVMAGAEALAGLIPQAFQDAPPTDLTAHAPQ